MCLCPNHNRKRLGPGGGLPQCDGTVELVVRVPVTLTFNAVRIPKGCDSLLDVAPARIRNGGGITLANDAIRKAIDKGDADLVCDACGWSLNRCAIAADKKAKR